MPFSRSLVCAAIACLVFSTACARQDAAVAVTTPTATPSAAAFHEWLGVWNGPEGTYLELIAKDDSTFTVLIQDLDEERSFVGTAGTDYIQFERDGVQEKIRATNGEDTGMKWLADSERCLTINEGEGYCRD